MKRAAMIVAVVAATVLQRVADAPGGDEAPTAETAAAAVATVLDDFHAAAAAADGPRYFGHFAPEGVFLGTDATERWTLEEFKAFAKPYFDKGKGWAYKAKSRHVQLSPAGDVAWFDEALESASYGDCRGSGVLRRMEGAWKIAQYNLTIPIPNDLAADFVAKIRAAAKK